MKIHGQGLQGGNLGIGKETLPFPKLCFIETSHICFFVFSSHAFSSLPRVSLAFTITSTHSSLFFLPSSPCKLTPKTMRKLSFWEIQVTRKGARYMGQLRHLHSMREWDFFVSFWLFIGQWYFHFIFSVAHARNFPPRKTQLLVSIYISCFMRYFFHNIFMFLYFFISTNSLPLSIIAITDKKFLQVS